MKMNIQSVQLIAVLLLTLGKVNSAFPQSLEDFEKAVSKEGCASIPYEDYRRKCEDSQREVNRCTESPWTCRDMDPRPLKENIQRMNETISRLKKENENFERTKSSSSSDDEKRTLDDKIKTTSESIKRMDGEINSAKERLYNEKRITYDNISKGERCVQYRKDVQEAFAKARYAAVNESDPAKRKFGNQLAEKWDKGANEHATSITNWSKQIETCKDYYSANN